MRVVVLADTHIRSGGEDGEFRPALPPAVVRALSRADVILHAGDVVDAALLEALAKYAPVHAVLGNNDRTLVGVLPERLEMRFAGVPMAMVHDSGPRLGRPARLRRWFPEAALVVFGHSHLPQDELGVDRQRLFNPGSPTQRRRAPMRTYGELDLEAGRVRRHRIVSIDPSAPDPGAGSG